MIKDLSSDDASSLKSNFTAIRTKFKSGFDEFALVQTTLTQTLEILKKFSEDFKKITNFSILRSEFLSFEAAFCFS